MDDKRVALLNTGASDVKLRNMALYLSFSIQVLNYDLHYAILLEHPHDLEVEFVVGTTKKRHLRKHRNPLVHRRVVSQKGHKPFVTKPCECRSHSK